MNDDTVLFLTDEELDSSTGGARVISYGALARNRNRNGAASPANPYHRGCSPATRCRS